MQGAGTQGGGVAASATPEASSALQRNGPTGPLPQARGRLEERRPCERPKSAVSSAWGRLCAVTAYVAAQLSAASVACAVARLAGPAARSGRLCAGRGWQQPVPVGAHKSLLLFCLTCRAQQGCHVPGAHCRAHVPQAAGGPFLTPRGARCPHRPLQGATRGTTIGVAPGPFKTTPL